MHDDDSHAACVDAWLTRATQHASADRLAAHFETALQALWTRTKTTLGEVTLTAIADRVLYIASENFPFMAALKVEPATGIVFGDLRERFAALPTAQVIAGIRFVLVELLTVLGNLTAEILTPELHAQLSRLALPEAVRLEGGRTSSEPTQQIAARTRAHDEEN